jgi:hypothetical protein
LRETARSPTIYNEGRQHKGGRGIERSSPECFSIQAIALFDLIKRVLFERGFDVIQNVIHMMFVWPGGVASPSNQDFKSKLDVAGGLTATD